MTCDLLEWKWRLIYWNTREDEFPFTCLIWRTWSYKCKILVHMPWYLLPSTLTLLLNSHFLFLAGWKTVRHFGSLEGGANLVLPSGVLQGGLYNNLWQDVSFKHVSRNTFQKAYWILDFEIVLMLSLFLADFN